MSRLQSFIRRMQAQEILLDQAALDITDIDGEVLELGLGNGRTFDHLRQILPKRRILVFEKKYSAPPGVKINEDDLVMGDIQRTGPQYAQQHFRQAALVHADLGTGNPKLDAEILMWLPELLASLARPGAIVLSGLPLTHAKLQDLPLPESIAEGRYGVYRAMA